MFKLKVRDTANSSGELLYICISNIYVAVLIATIVLFGQMIECSIFEFNFSIAASVVAYVFLYPITFIVFRIYGYKATNQLIFSVFIGSLFFFVFCFLITSIHTSDINANVSGLKLILHKALKMYLYGLVGMPAGIYTGVFTLIFFVRLFKDINVLAVFMATIVGELVNTIIVFPATYWSITSWSALYNLIIDALAFKVLAAFVLCYPTIFLINFINTKIKYRKL